MKLEQYTYWSFTLNNPTDAEMVIIRNPNEKYIRQFVWTPEVGEKEGTPHIQGWVKLQRNQTKSFMIKLYPRASVRGIAKDEYNERCHDYAQKNDGTTAGNHVISLNDPLPVNDTLLYKVLEVAWDFEYSNVAEPISHLMDCTTLHKLNTIGHERQMVRERAGLEKIFCSPAYEKMKTTFWKEILFRILTHRQDEQRSAPQEVESTSTDSHDYEESESETDEGPSESSSYQTDEEDD